MTDYDKKLDVMYMETSRTRIEGTFFRPISIEDLLVVGEKLSKQWEGWYGSDDPTISADTQVTLMAEKTGEVEETVLTIGFNAGTSSTGYDLDEDSEADEKKVN